MSNNLGVSEMGAGEAIPLASGRIRVDVDYIARSALFLAAFLLIWLTASPFQDLGDPKLLEPVGEGNFTGQILAVLLTASLAGFVVLTNARAISCAFTPSLGCVLIWFALSAAFCPYPMLAARRLVLAMFTIFQVAALLLLPRGRNHFSLLLAAAALIVLVICYGGVLFAPELSIHQQSDVAEPELAGDWRGAFTHKNGAGAAMVVLIFIGLFTMRSLSSVLGAAIVALAGLFLFFTQAKSPIRLLLPVLIMSYLVSWVRHPRAAKLVLALGMPAIIAILTVGSVSFESVGSLVRALVSDPTFTGRDDIWRFTLDKIAERPILGFGFQAFWGTGDLVSAWSYLGSWGYRASDAHNGYLNLAVMTGIVGLVLSLLWIVAQPLRDHVRAEDRGDGPLTALFLQVWLFGLCLCGFESVLFSGGDCLWFMMLLSIMGLRYQATAQMTG